MLRAARDYHASRKASAPTMGPKAFALGDHCMRVLAVRFPDRQRASAVLDRLQRTLDVAPPDVAIAPLGASDGRDGALTVLAGRFPEERLPEVTRLVREQGGEIVADVDESWTRPSPKRGSSSHH